MLAQDKKNIGPHSRFSPKMGIFHYAGIGDWLLFSPALREIKRLSPTTKIYVVGGRSLKWVLENDKNVDGFNIIPDCSVLKKHFKFDDKIFVSTFSGFFSLTQCRMHILNLTFKILRIPVSEQGIKPELHLSEEDEEFGSRYADLFNDRMVTLCNDASLRLKSWDIQKWAKVVKIFKKCVFVQIGESNTQPIPGAVRMAGRTTLTQALSLVKHSRLFAGVDGLFNHVANMFNTPKVILWGMHNPRNFVYRGNSINIWKDFHCAPCVIHTGRSCSSRANPALAKCMAAITTHEVANAIKKSLQLSYNPRIKYYRPAAQPRKYCARCKSAGICSSSFFMKRLSDLYLWKLVW
ncbi:MAG: glycosyltransferase family 9 protein [Candidatus Omnitrophota bacterium]